MTDRLLIDARFMAAIRIAAAIAFPAVLYAHRTTAPVVSALAVLLGAGAVLTITSLAIEGRRRETLAAIALFVDVPVLGLLFHESGGDASPLLPLVAVWAVGAAASFPARPQVLAYASALAAMLAVVVASPAPRSNVPSHALLGVTAVVAVVGAAASHAAMARLRAAYGEQELLALVDPLTGLWNRRALEYRISQLSAVEQRTRRPWCLALVDLDEFKSVNDEHGHATGDLVLKEVASRLLSRLRPSDEVFRYGGEEFVVVLPGTTVELGAQAIERVRRAFEQDSTMTVPVRISAGIVQSDGSGAAVVEVADAMLLRAKAAGRNRVEVSLRSVATIRRVSPGAWRPSPGEPPSAGTVDGRRAF